MPSLAALLLNLTTQAPYLPIQPRILPMAFLQLLLPSLELRQALPQLGTLRRFGSGRR